MTAARSVDTVTGELADLACEVATDRTPTAIDVTRLRPLVAELAAVIPEPGPPSGDPEDPDWCELGLHRRTAPGPCPACAELCAKNGLTLDDLEAAVAERACTGGRLTTILAAAPTRKDQP